MKRLGKVNPEFRQCILAATILVLQMKRAEEMHALQGWRQIANYLAQPVSVAQRWAKSGMPVSRDGRRVFASPNDLNRWLARESAGEPVHIVSKDTDLGSALKRGLSLIRKQEAKTPKKKAA
ncbi:MAG: hypothetical protein JO266_14440 [Acidobacteria bacterium]|nr:hypothetical protein [Acidobacteriota bacterium]